MKTNAMRILESLGIDYAIRSYQWDEDHLDAVHAAHSLGMDEEQVCKTIVMRNQDNQVFVFVLPAPFDINLKKARQVTGSREIDLVKAGELRALTGYIRGGCSPLGMLKNHPVFLEETIQLQERICVSAGQRGLQLFLAVSDLAKATQAVFADLI